MRYVYVGTAASDRDIEAVFSKTARTKIVYVQQKWDYIFYKAMEACGEDTFCVSYPPVQTFPAGKRIRIGRMPIFGLKQGVYIPVLNIPVIKQALSVLQVLRELGRIGKGEDLAVITHTLYLQSLLAARWYKRFHPRTKIVSLVPDLPDYTSDEKLSSSRLNRLLYRWYAKLSMAVKGDVDGYVCFSQRQMERLDTRKPFMVMEGFSVGGSLPEKKENPEAEDKKVFFYAGNLKADSGVLTFCRAFAKAALPDAELWICGEGEQQAEIEDLRCPAIRLLGVLPREEVLQLERQACVLVNPRPINEAYAKYSFPSKLLEYMSTGTPVLTTHLLCIPSEYDGYLTYMEDDTEEGMRSTLSALQTDPEKGRRAREFVLREKNPAVQAQRVVDYVKTLGDH